VKTEQVLADTNRPHNAFICVMLSCHHCVHKAGCWVWSTGDGRRSTWQWSSCHRKITCNIRSEVGEKFQRKLRLLLEIFKFRICLINILQLQGAFS